MRQQNHVQLDKNSMHRIHSTKLWKRGRNVRQNQNRNNTLPCVCRSVSCVHMRENGVLLSQQFAIIWYVHLLNTFYTKFFWLFINLFIYFFFVLMTILCEKHSYTNTCRYNYTPNFFLSNHCKKFLIYFCLDDYTYAVHWMSIFFSRKKGRYSTSSDVICHRWWIMIRFDKIW